MPGHIVTLGGGGFSMEPESPLLDAYVLSLARRPRPRVCFVATASGDAPTYAASFFRAFGRLHDAVTTDLRCSTARWRTCGPSCSRRTSTTSAAATPRTCSRSGGCTGSARSCARRSTPGRCCAGISAGMNCFYEASTTDSFGAGLAPLHDGLGFVAGSACPHYDGEPQRRPLYRPRVEPGAERALATRLLSARP